MFYGCQYTFKKPMFYYNNVLIERELIIGIKEIKIYYDIFGKRIIDHEEIKSKAPFLKTLYQLLLVLNTGGEVLVIEFDSRDEFYSEKLNNEKGNLLKSLNLITVINEENNNSSR